MSNSKAKWIMTLFSVLLAALLVVSCGPRQIIADQEATRCAQNIVDQLDGSKQSLLKTGNRLAPQDCGVTLHVSMSANMQGYLARRDQTAKFREVLADIAKIPAQDLEIDAIGTPRDGGFAKANPEMRDLQVQNNYDRKDNDFTPAIRDIADQPRRLHLILTDGVEWHTNLLDYYQEVFHSANQFLKRGGNIAFMLFRGDYRGTYSSVVLTAQHGPHSDPLDSIVDYDVPNRPFLLWAFLPPGVSLDSLEKDYLKFGKPDFDLDLRDGDIVPIVATKEFPEPNRGRGRELLRDSQMVYASPDLQPFIKASINDDVTENGYFPLEFELQCSKKLMDNFEGHLTNLVAWLNEAVRAELECWELKRLHGGVYTNNLIPNDQLNILGGKWEILKSPRDGVVGASEEDQRPRLVFRISKPPGESQGTRFFAWVLTLRPTPRVCDNLIPSQFTTIDDSKPEQADRILNLGNMMATLASQTEVLGRVLVITEWR